nr:MAG TPA: hypothetical protein [Caudoviricetes sp.]DAV06501.1 MAG TPA: hypothetical protein [Caudoviricetes sp.]
MLTLYSAGNNYSRISLKLKRGRRAEASFLFLRGCV